MFKRLAASLLHHSGLCASNIRSAHGYREEYGDLAMTFHADRRAVLAGLGALAAGLRGAAAQEGTPDLILFNGRITTLDRQSPQAQAIAIRGDRFAAAGTEQEIMRLAGPSTRRIDIKGRRVIPGLI